MQSHDVGVPARNALQDRDFISNLTTNCPSAQPRVQSCPQISQTKTHQILLPLDEFLVDDLAGVQLARLEVLGLPDNGVGSAAEESPGAILLTGSIALISGTKSRRA